MNLQRKAFFGVNEFHQNGETAAIERVPHKILAESGDQFTDRSSSEGAVDDRTFVFRAVADFPCFPDRRTVRRQWTPEAFRKFMSAPDHLPVCRLKKQRVKIIFVQIRHTAILPLSQICFFAVNIAQFPVITNPIQENTFKNLHSDGTPCRIFFRIP